MAGLLKKMGFDKVFDFTFAADLTIVEETTEFLNRVTKNENLPQFTSCCPGWVNFVERRYPEIIPHLSSCKSPNDDGCYRKNHFTQLKVSTRRICLLFQSFLALLKSMRLPVRSLLPKVSGMWMRF
jgi:hypothetical protein